MQHDGQAPQRFGEDCSLAVALSGGDRGFVTVNRFGDTGVPLAAPSFVQQIRGGT